MSVTEKKSLSKPPWLKIRPQFDEVYREVKDLVSEMGLHTVCQEATCPNIGECYSARTATFIILGDTCTRGCRFCDVKKGKPTDYDLAESSRVAGACEKLGMRFAVITSVTRDDLPDGGAAMFAGTTRSIKSMISSCGVELLIPDLAGNIDALKVILNSDPDVLAHYFPWLSSVAISLQAGFWEEAFCRAIPLAGIVLITRKSKYRNFWIIMVLFLQTMSVHFHFQRLQPSYGT